MTARRIASAAVMLTAALLDVACTTSGNLAPSDGGFLVEDGSIVLSDGQPISAAGHACVFDQRATYTCPDETLAPTPWEGECVDNDDCRGRINGAQNVAGCSVAVQYANAQLVNTSCAAWSAAGGKLPTADAGPAPACAPGTASFTPKWHAPRVVAGACTKALIDSYRQCLDDSATTLNPPSCSPWIGSPSTANQTCLSCLVSNETDSNWGPIVQLPSESLINVPGCLAVAEGKTDGSGCGGALAAYEQCARNACLPTCPVGTASEASAESACEVATQTGTCQSFATAAECATAIQDGEAGAPAEAACFGATNDAQFEAVALVLCGG